MIEAFAPICAFIHDLRFQDIPPDALHMSCRCLVDLLAVWASGAATRSSRLARDHAVRHHSNRPACVPMPFDGHDGHEHCKGHAGAAVLPALLAELGTAPACSMEDLLPHLIVGYEIAIRAGRPLAHSGDQFLSLPRLPLGTSIDRGARHESIGEVIVRTFEEAARLDTQHPRDGDQAQYSLPLAVALVLVHGPARQAGR